MRAAPSARISSSSRSRSQTKNPRRFQVVARARRAEPDALERPPHRVLLAGVVEAGQPQIEPGGPYRRRCLPIGLGTADRERRRRPRRRGRGPGAPRAPRARPGRSGPRRGRPHAARPATTEALRVLAGEPCPEARDEARGDVHVRGLGLEAGSGIASSPARACQRSMWRRSISSISRMIARPADRISSRSSVSRPCPQRRSVSSFSASRRTRGPYRPTRARAASSSWWRRSSSGMPSSTGSRFRRASIASTGFTTKKNTAAATATNWITAVRKAP